MKITLTVLFSLISFFYITAQISFSEHIITDETYNILPVSVYADLDGDMDLDIISGSNNGKVVWHENIDGLGSYGNYRIISDDFNGIVDFDIADIDGDGDIDVLTTSSDDDRIAWFENIDGLGNFSISANIITAEFPREISGDDFDGDGDIDILVFIGVNNDRVVWHENLDGLGNFGAEVFVDSGNVDNAVSLSSDDIDGDGDQDIYVISANSENIVWFENEDGMGDFGTVQFVGGGNSPRNLQTIDLDNDGDLDLLCAITGTDRIGWYRNLDGQGNFSAFISLISNVDSISALSTLDIDGDFDLDLVVSKGFSTSNVVWYENTDGLGNFGSEQIIDPNISNFQSDFYLGDVDSDGDGDLLFTTQDDVIYYNNLNGLGVFSKSVEIVTYLNRATAIGSADIDGDGDNDFIAGGFDKITWFDNFDGEGLFIGGSTISKTVRSIRSIDTADFDGDGDIDILSTSALDDEIAWYENLDGLGDFGSQQIISSLSINPNFAIPADLDNDGDLDVIARSTNSNGSIIGWYENTDGMGTFSSEQIIGQQLGSSHNLVADDLDNDGDLDIVSTSSQDNTIFWFENIDGLGTFGPQNIINTQAFSGISAATADIDGDGDVDVLSITDTDYQLAWFENIDGMGTFGTPLTIGSLDDFAVGVYAEDVDNDGDKDVVSGESSGVNLVWYENLDGLGSFGNQQLIPIANSTLGSITPADINNDGIIDFITTAGGIEDTVLWFKNLGILGLEDIKGLSFTIAPNPSKGKISITSNTQIVHAKIYDQLGRFVFEKANDIGMKELDLTFLKTGLYFLQIINGSGEKGVKMWLKQ